MIKKLCLLLSLILAFSLLGACSSSKGKEDVSSDASSQVSDDVESDYSEDEGDVAELPEDEDDYSEDDYYEDDYYEDDYYEDDYYEDDYYEDDYYDNNIGNNDNSYQDNNDNSYEDEYFDGDYFGDDYFEEEKYVNHLNVYNNEEPITERYGGMSGTVWHAFGFMKDDKTGRVYSDKMMNIELERLQNTGVRYCRTRYTSEWAWDPAKEQYDWNADRFGYFCDYANALQDRDIDIILSVGWHFGFVSHIDDHSIDEVLYLNGEGEDKFGESVGAEDIYKDLSAEDARMTRAARRFGYFYAETLRQLRARGINNISHLLYMTEPSNSYLGAEAGAENEAYLLFSRAFKQKLIEENVAHTVKHMGPNETSKTGDILFKYVVDNDPELFDVYTVHDYPHMTDVTVDVLNEIYGKTLDSFVKHAKKAGIYGKKEFWLDEYDVNYDGKAGGQSVSWAGLQNVFGCIMAQQRGLENTVLWMLFDQLWTDHTNNGGEFVEGIHMCGDIPSLFNGSIPYDQYYIIGLFMKYNGYKNGKVYRTSYFEDSEMFEGVYTGAVQLEDGSWTITVVNLNIDEAYIDLSFDKAINQTLYRHVCATGDLKATPDARLADADKCFKDVKNKLYDTIPGGSITIYTGLKG